MLVWPCHSRREKGARYPYATVTDATGAFVLGPAPAALFHLAASYDVPGANHTALWRQAGAHEAGLHRLEIALDLDAR